MILIKAALAVLAGILCARSIKRDDGTLAVYWEFVAIYWIINALDQIVGG